MNEKVIYCKNCRYILKPTGAMYEPHPDSLCTSKIVVNFVSANPGHPLCRDINTNGNCEWYKEKNP